MSTPGMIVEAFYVLPGKRGSVFSDSTVFSYGRLAQPLVVSLPPGELLLGKENIGVFVDQNGKLLQADGICWSEAPTTVIIQKPYAIALLPRRVEIRSLRVPFPLIQTVVLQNVRHLIPSTNAVTIASGNFVFGLFPVPFGAQIVQLTASGDFEEAMALCKLLPPEDSSLRAVKEGSIHISLLKFTLIYIYKHPNIVYIIQRRIYQLMATEFSKFSVLPELFNMTIAFWQFRRLLN